MAIDLVSAGILKEDDLRIENKPGRDLFSSGILSADDFGLKKQEPSPQPSSFRLPESSPVMGMFGLKREDQVQQPNSFRMPDNSIAGDAIQAVKDVGNAGIEKAQSVGQNALATVGLAASDIGQAATGLWKITPQGYVAGKIAEKYGTNIDDVLGKIGLNAGVAQKFYEGKYTDEQKKDFEAVKKAEGLWNTIGESFKRPSTIAYSAERSLIPMAFGGMGARVVIAKVGPQTLLKYGPTLSKLTGLAPKEAQTALALMLGAANEGILQTGQSLDDLSKTEGGLNPKKVGSAVASGGFDAAISLAGGRLAGKLGFDDIDTMLAGGKTAQKSVSGIKDAIKQYGKSIAGGGLTEAFFEEAPQTAQEQMFYNAAVGKPIFEGVGNAIGQAILPAFFMGAGANAKTAASQIVDEKIKGLKTNKSNNTDNQTGKLIAERDRLDGEIAKLSQAEQTEGVKNNLANMVKFRDELNQQIESVKKQPEPIRVNDEQDTSAAEIQKFRANMAKAYQAKDQQAINTHVADFLRNPNVSQQVKQEVADKMGIAMPEAEQAANPADKANVPNTPIDTDQTGGESVIWKKQIEEQRRVRDEKQRIERIGYISNSLKMLRANPKKNAELITKLEAQLASLQPTDIDYRKINQVEIDQQDINAPESAPVDVNRKTDDISMALKFMLDDALATETRKTTAMSAIDAEAAGQEEVRALPATSSDWYKELNRRAVNDRKEIYTRAEIENLVTKHLNGEKLTDKQALRLELLQKVATDEILGKHPDFIAAQNMREFSGRGWKTLGGEAAAVGMFGPGDKVLARIPQRQGGVLPEYDEEYTVVGENDKGEVIFQDKYDRKIAVDIFEKIPVMSWLKAPEKSVIDRTGKDRRVSPRRDEERLDGLTGVPDKEVIRPLLAEAAKDANNLIFFFDLDTFKFINDSYGHSGGDKVLTATGGMLNKYFPDNKRGRFGGEEFAVILPNNDESVAAVRKFMEDFPKKVTIYGEPVTISGGLAPGFSPKDADGYLADDLNYNAKEAGRNQIVVDKGDGKTYTLIGSKVGEKNYEQDQELARREKGLLKDIAASPPEDRPALERALQRVRAGRERSRSFIRRATGDAQEVASQESALLPNTTPAAVPSAQTVTEPSTEAAPASTLEKSPVVAPPSPTNTPAETNEPGSATKEATKEPWQMAEDEVKPYADGLRILSDKELREEDKKISAAINKWANGNPAILPGGKLNPVAVQDSHPEKKKYWLLSAQLRAIGQEQDRRTGITRSKKPVPAENLKEYGLEAKSPGPQAQAEMQAAYHGTPHTLAPEPGFPHGRFRLDKIGTGEGAQAYGWGVYFASSDVVGRSYAHNIDKTLMVDGVPLRSANISKDAVNLGQYMAITGKTYEETYNTIKVRYDKYKLWLEKHGESARKKYEDAKHDLDTISEFAGKNIEIVDPSGNLYALDIPDDVMPKLLDWDNPVGVKELNKIKMGIAKEYSDNNKLFEPLKDFINVVGERNKRNDLAPYYTGEIVYNEISKILGSDKLASDFFNRAGIPGLKYLDQMSRGKGEGSHNYVIWDQEVLDRIAMLERNGERLDAIQKQQSDATASDIADAEWNRQAEQVLVHGKSKAPVYLGNKDFLSRLKDLYPSYQTTGRIIRAFYDTRDGSVYINKDHAQKNTIFHEYAHPALNMVMQSEPKLYQQAGALVKGTEYWEWATKNYDGVDTQITEALAQMIADRGVKFQDQAQKNKAMFFVKRIYHKVKALMKQVFGHDLTLDEFVDSIAYGMRKGKYSDSQGGNGPHFMNEGQQPEDVLISRKDGGTAASVGESSRYLTLAERYKAGDKSVEPELQKMVDEAARKAGYNVGPVYHAGDGKNGDMFRGFAHFGTKKAASDRIATSPRNIKKPRLYTVFLDIQNPIKLTDNNLDNPYNLMSYAVQKLELTEAEKKIYHSNEFKEDKGKRLAQLFELAADIFKRYGYDGLIYKNKVEDIGSTSYVTFEPSQIKSADPVTYDDNGNIIPLEDRFKDDRKEDEWKNPDIRFQAEKHDPMEAAKRFLDSFEKDTVDVAPKVIQSISDRDKARSQDFKLSKEDITLADRVLNLMSHFSDKVPALKRIYNAGLEWVDDKYHNANKIFHDNNGNSHLDVIKKLEKQDKKGYENLQEYLLERDRNAVGYRVEHNEKSDKYNLINHDGKKAGEYSTEDEAWSNAIEMEASDAKVNGFTDDMAKALMAFRNISHNIFRMRYAAIDELVKKYEEDGRKPEIAYRDDNGEAVRVDLKVALAEMGDLRGFYFPRIRQQGQWIIRAKKEGAQPILEMRDLKTTASMRRKSLEKQGYQVSPITRSERVPESVFALAGQNIAINELIDKALENVSSPRVKTLKDIGITAKWDGDDYIIYGMFDKGKDIEIIDAYGGEYEEFKKQTDKAKIFGGRYRFKNADKNIENKLTKALFISRGHESADLELLFANDFAKELANTIKERGARSALIQRRRLIGKNVWAGYEEDPMRAISLAGQSTASAQAKKEMAIKMINAFQGTTEKWSDWRERMKAEGYETTDGKRHFGSNYINYDNYIDYVKEQKLSATKQKNAFETATIYMQDMLRNDEAIDRIMGTIKGLAVLKYLGFRVAAPAVNMTALVTNVPAAMNGYADIPLHSVPGLLTGAIKDYSLWWKNGKNSLIGVDEKRALEYIHDKGWHEAQLNREAANVLKGKLGKAWGVVIDASMYMFGATEKLNRVSTILGAYKGIKKSHPELSFEEQIKLAKKVSDRAHGTYGKANYPEMARGSGLGPQTLRAAYVFKTFSHNYLATLKEIGFDEKNAKAATWMLISPAIVAGATASMATPIALGLMGLVGGGDDPEKELYGWVKDNAGENAAQFVEHGAAGLFGLNLKGSLALNITDIPTNLIELLGAPGSVVGDVVTGIGSMARGDVYKGVEKLVPNAVASPMQAYREYNYGVTTKNNTPVFYGAEQLKPDLTDAIIKALSFNPSELSSKKEKIYKEKAIEQKYKDERQEINSRIKAYAINKKRDPEEWADILERVLEYNTRLRHSGMIRVLSPISGQDINTMMKKARVPNKTDKKRAALYEE